MLEDEWKLVSGSKVELIVAEVPLTLTNGFIKGNYNEFELVKKAFNMEFHLNNKTTSFFNLLFTFTNFNLARNKQGKSKQYFYKCN